LGPNIEYDDKNCVIYPKKLLYSMPEEHLYIEFSNKLAILNIWPHNIDYTGWVPGNFEFMGCGHFVTHIQYSATKWPCVFEVIYANSKIARFDIFMAASFESALYSNLAVTDPSMN
jgi:hypothetical protein